MNSLCAIVRLSAIWLLVICNNADVHAQEADGAINKFFNWLFEEPEAADLAVVEMAVEVPIDVSEVEQRAVRLIAWSSAMTDWTSQVAQLSKAQKEAMKQLNSNAIEVAKAKPERGMGQFNGQNAFGESLVIRFTAKNGLAQSIDPTSDPPKLASLNLTKEQKAQLSTAVKKRQEFLREANLGYILNIVDSDLCLTNNQRAGIAEIIRDSIDLDASCYAMQTTNYYFQQTSIATIFQNKAVRELLTKSQQIRSQDMRKNSVQQHTSFTTNEGMDGWQTKLTKLVSQETTRLQRAANVRVDFVAKSAKLDEKERRYLQIASKGAVENVIRAWKTQAQRQLDNWEKQALQFAGQNVTFSVTAGDVRQFDKNELWDFTVSSLTDGNSESARQRDATRNAARARHAVAMLDRELWLSDSQRKKMTDKVGAVMPPADYEIQNSAYFREIGLLVIPLFKLSNRDLDFLSPVQKAAWKELKKPFQHQGNYVRVQMKNGGSMHLTIPR